MEKLLVNNNYHWVRALSDVTIYSIDKNDMESVSNPYNIVTYYVYKDGHLKDNIKQKITIIVMQYFPDQEKPFSEFRIKNKFSVLESFVHKNRKGADRFYTPF